MSHKRASIRNALVQMLKGTAPIYNTTAQDRIEDNRVLSFKKLPSINIYDGSENAKKRDMSGRSYVRQLDLKIDATVEEETGTDLDNIAKEIEDIILSDISLLGTSISSEYTGFEKTYEQAEKKIGKITLNYIITYIY